METFRRRISRCGRSSNDRLDPASGTQTSNVTVMQTKTGMTTRTRMVRRCVQGFVENEKGMIEQETVENKEQNCNEETEATLDEHTSIASPARAKVKCDSESPITLHSVTQQCENETIPVRDLSDHSGEVSTTQVLGSVLTSPSNTAHAEPTHMYLRNATIDDESGINEKFALFEEQLQQKFDHFRASMIDEIKRHYRKPKCESCCSDVTDLSFDYDSDSGSHPDDDNLVAHPDDDNWASQAAGDALTSQPYDKNSVSQPDGVGVHGDEGRNMQESSASSHRVSDNYPIHDNDSAASWVICLPPMIKVLIFSYLSLGDRKAVRLVYKDWCEMAWSRSLSKKDCVKIIENDDIYYTSYHDVCSDKGLDKMPRVLDTFQTSPHSVKAFHLERVPYMRRRDYRFWNHFGQTMLELKLVNCPFRHVDMMRMLHACACLQRLEIVNCPLLLPPAERNQIPSENANVEVLAENPAEGSEADGQCEDCGKQEDMLHIKQNLSNLKVFALELNISSQYTNLDYLVGVFPPLLDEFHIRINNKLLTQENVRQIASQLLDGLKAKELHLSFEVCSPSPSRLREMLAVALSNPETKLRSLTLTAPLDKDLCQLLDQHSSSLRSLTMVISAISDDDAIQESLTNDLKGALAKMSCLRSINLNCSASTSVSVSGYSLYPVLIELKSLQSVTFAHDPRVPSGSKLALYHLVKRNLKRMCLDTLGTLPLVSLVYDGFLRCTSMIQLTDLQLSRTGIPDTVLDLLCRILPHLRSLSIIDCPLVTDKGITGDFISDVEDTNATVSCGIARLEFLTDLSLEGPFTEVAVRSLRFRELRKLRLVCSSFGEEALVGIARNNPSLENLYFKHHDEDGGNSNFLLSYGRFPAAAEAFADFLRACKRLRYLDGVAGMDEIEELLTDAHMGEKLCPSLRYVNDAFIKID